MKLNLNKNKENLESDNIDEVDSILKEINYDLEDSEKSNYELYLESNKSAKKEDSVECVDSKEDIAKSFVVKENVENKEKAIENFEVDEIVQNDDIIIKSNDVSEEKNPISIGVKETSIMYEVFLWIESFVIAIVFVVFVFTFLFRIVGVVGPSMENTLKTSDRLVISNLFYEPAVGDVVVFIPNLKEYENKPFVKRIIAVENQVVDINEQTGEVFVDGKLLKEDYIKMPTYLKGTQTYPVTVEPGKVFVMGDNRGDSTDSRFESVGTVDKRAIIGRCLTRIYPFNKIGALNK